MIGSFCSLKFCHSSLISPHHSCAKRHCVCATEAWNTQTLWFHEAAAVSLFSILGEPAHIVCTNVDFKVCTTDNVKVENMWIEVSRNSTKYIIGGLYRHPNRNIPDLIREREKVLNRISYQNIPCTFAGDINIDLIKCRINILTEEYLNTL